jgi:hypothetical protein
VFDLARHARRAGEELQTEVELGVVAQRLGEDFHTEPAICRQR